MKTNTKFNKAERRVSIVFTIAIITILLSFTSLIAQSPEPLNRDYDITLVEVKGAVQVDSILIFEAGKAGPVGKVYLIEDLQAKLEEIAKKNSRFKFNVVKYYIDGRVIQCKVRRKVDFNINN